MPAGMMTLVAKAKPKRGRPRKTKKQNLNQMLYVVPRRIYKSKTNRSNTINGRTQVKTAQTVRHRYMNSAVTHRDLQFNNSTQHSICLGFDLNSPRVFMDGGSKLIFSGTTGDHIEWSKPIDDDVSSATATCVDDYNTDMNYAHQYKNGQVLGSSLDITLEVIRSSSSDADSVHKADRNVCPIKVFLVKQTVYNNKSSLTDVEQWREKPYSYSKELPIAYDAQNSKIRFSLKHSPRKFNGERKGQFVGKTKYQFSTSTASTTLPEQDSCLLVITPANKALVNVGRTIAPELLLDFKMTKLIRYNEVSNSSNDPLPQADTLEL